MDKDYNVTNKDLTNLEKEIEQLDEIKDWTIKIKKMKELKERILLQKNKLNTLIESVNSGEIKKSKKKKEMSLDELLKEFEKCEDIEEKIKLFNQIQYIIKEAETELFDE